MAPFPESASWWGEVGWGTFPGPSLLPSLEVPWAPSGCLPGGLFAAGASGHSCA